MPPTYIYINNFLREDNREGERERGTREKERDNTGGER